MTDYVVLRWHGSCWRRCRYQRAHRPGRHLGDGTYPQAGNLCRSLYVMHVLLDSQTETVQLTSLSPPQ